MSADKRWLRVEYPDGSVSIRRESVVLSEGAPVGTVIRPVEDVTKTWVHAGAQALATHWFSSDLDQSNDALAAAVIAAVEPLIREQIATEIETQPIDSWGSQRPRGPVTFARREAQLRSARIAREGNR